MSKELELDEVLGEIWGRRVRDAGYYSIEELQDAGAATLSRALGVDIDRAVSLLQSVRRPSNEYKHLAAEGESVLSMMQSQRARRPIATLCLPLDAMLGRGVAVCELTEFCGAPGLGKTQIAMQLACSVQIPNVLGGAQGQALYIDTEGGFSCNRIQAMAQGLINDMRLSISNRSATDQQPTKAIDSITVQSILQGIWVWRVHSHVEQFACVHALNQFLEEHSNIRLVIIDSVAFHLRHGFEDMSMRTRMISRMTQDLKRAAVSHECAVVVTNQVTTRGDNILVAALGTSWAHACTNRVMLRWEGDQRVANLIKSASQPPGQAYYAVTAVGIRKSTVKRTLKRSADRDEEEPANTCNRS